MSSPKPSSSKVTNKEERQKSKIQQQIDAAQDVHKKELLRRRIETARAGIKSYQSRRLGEAVKSFKLYIRILEDWKNVPEGGLHPGLFDRKKDADELFLISGVYWDLVKLYDRTSSQSKMSEFTHYLDKYVLFAKGMQHEALAGETIRKYISNNGARHAAQFKSAYKTIGEAKCFIVTSLYDHIEPSTLDIFREFRDARLTKSIFGRTFIRIYYRVGPALSKGIDKLPELLRIKIARTLDNIGKRITSE